MRTHEQGTMHVTASKVALESEMSFRQAGSDRRLGKNEKQEVYRELD